MLSAYVALVRSRLSAQMVYRGSFAFEVAAQFGIGFIDFAEIYVVFHQVRSLGGFSFAEVSMMFALTTCAFSLADMFVGHIDGLPDYVRTGQFDAMLLRPLSALGQLVTSDFSLRRIGRAITGLLVLLAALGYADIDWTLSRVLLLVVTPVAGCVIFCSIFVAAAAVSFWLVEGTEFANAFTYGGNYLSSLPFTIFHVAVRRFFTFVVPGAFVAYLPTLALLGRDDPAGLPGWLSWSGPLAALLAASRREPALAHRVAPLRGGGVVIVEVDQLRRDFVVRRKTSRFGRSRGVVTAVADVTFAIAPGECLGYIGANGAGKSTTVKMLMGILVPTSGRVRVCGLEPVRERTMLARRVGAVFGQRSQLWWDLPLADSFRLLGAIHRMPEAAWRARLRECADLLEMHEFLTTPYASSPWATHAR